MSCIFSGSFYCIIAIIVPQVALYTWFGRQVLTLSVSCLSNHWEGMEISNIYCEKDNLHWFQAYYSLSDRPHYTLLALSPLLFLLRPNDSLLDVYWKVAPLWWSKLSRLSLPLLPPSLSLSSLPTTLLFLSQWTTFTTNQFRSLSFRLGLSLESPVLHIPVLFPFTCGRFCYLGLWSENFQVISVSLLIEPWNVEWRGQLWD